MGTVQFRLDSWFLRNLVSLKTVMRVVFGLVWLVDGALKFQPGLPDQWPDMISAASQGQPAWLAPWFKFWSQTVATNASLYVYLVGVLELALGLALVLGFLRKIAYAGGVLLSLVMWSVPEGFGGPYGPGSTDIGTGIIYAFVFILLMVINATFGPSKYSLDHMIEKRLPSWAKAAEIQSHAFNLSLGVPQ